MSSNIRHLAESRLPSRRGGVLQGCLIVGGIVLIIVVAVVIWVALSWKGWVAEGLKTVTAQAVQQSGLPEDQKTRITKKVDGLADDFKAGKITFEQFGQILNSVGQSPLLTIGMVYAAEEKYVKPSGLSKEEKEAANRAFQRLSRGAVEGKISQSALNRVLDPIAESDGAGGHHGLKQTVTTEELKKFIELVKKEADDAKIPDEEYKVNVAEELEKVIDKAIGKPAGG